MISWGNSSDKSLNASESYVMRNEEKKIGKYFIFQIQLQLKTLMPWKGLQRLNQTNTGLCWGSFRIFLICSNARIVNIHDHGNNPGSAAIYSRERSRVMRWHHMRWESRFDCKLPGQLSRNLAKCIENYLTYKVCESWSLSCNFMAVLKSLLISIYLIVNCLIVNRL